MDFLISAALTVMACPLPLVGPLRVYLLNKLNKALEPRQSITNPTLPQSELRSQPDRSAEG